jgi:hypothetical protein
MSSMTTGRPESRLAPGDWGGNRRVEERSSGPSWGLLVTGLVVVGLGAWAAYYLGPDLRRYLKIKSM